VQFSQLRKLRDLDLDLYLRSGRGHTGGYIWSRPTRQIRWKSKKTLWTYGRTDGRTHLSSNLLGHRPNDCFQYKKLSYRRGTELRGRSCGRQHSLFISGYPRSTTNIILATYKLLIAPFGTPHSLWNQLPSSLRQPHSSPSVFVLSVHASTTPSHFVNSPLSPSMTPCLFHSRLKTYCTSFTNLSDPGLPPSLRTDSTDFTTGLSISVFIRSSPGADLVDWKLGLSVRPYGHNFFPISI